MLHRVRLYKSAAGCVAVCAETSESAVGVGIASHLSAMQQLNGRCGCRHRKAYNIWEEENKFVTGKEMRIRGNSIVERQTVTQLNARVYGR